jgi:oligopeptide transport system substrate-binding protein
MLFSGCTGRQTPVDIGIRDQVLHLGNQTEPQDLDPHIITGVPEMNIISALLEGLVSEDPKDLHPVPGVAERWETSPDGLRYTFHLRPDAMWSNGERVTAGDFVYSFQRILSPGLASEYAYMLYCLKNGEDFNKGTITDFAQVGAKAVDSATLVVDLKGPTPYFLSMLSHSSYLPVNPRVIAKFGKIDERGTRWTRPGNFVGNGPFTLAAWETNKVIVVRKSTTYWDSKTTRLKEVRFYPIESDQTEERAFRSGQLHITHTVPVNKLAYYRTQEPSILHINPYLCTYYYLLNVHKPPLDNVLVRKALAMSVDRAALVSGVTKAGEIPAHFFTPPNTAGYTSTDSIPTDVAKARELLAQAGYPDGKGFPPLDILYNTSEQHQLIAQAIQEMWRKNLGITVTLTNQEWKVYLDAQTRKDYQVSRSGWSGDYNDPNTFLDMWVTGGGNNRTGWSSPAYDSLIAATTRTNDQTRRFSLFAQAEKILLDDASIIPIYFYVSKELRHPSVQGWYPTILDRHPYKYVWLEAGAGGQPIDSAQGPQSGVSGQ